MTRLRDLLPKARDLFLSSSPAGERSGADVVKAVGTGSAVAGVVALSLHVATLLTAGLAHWLPDPLWSAVFAGLSWALAHLEALKWGDVAAPAP